jgi:hypothetical protein
LESLGDFPLNGMLTTHVQAFDSSPMVFFFGFKANNWFGIKIITQSSEILCNDAHRDVITSFQQATINNESYLFSGSRDSQLKAWSLVNGQLVCKEVK